ncbi:MAG: 50S ribosomal protein L4 [Rhodanobacteraceae bacterium]|nr:50S ribosomal protein L4 [Rhodanobacteraceae bacterium]MBL0042185.1 50S ribosomal protein L4 [Xanthomonadales bacterium]MBP6078304.1 50S ribosomal protein L4 [Xanthomonadales bacterium]MBP7622613.1 50S ribosomal protein L4 [Xanthomonadales bacterium]
MELNIIDSKQPLSVSDDVFGREYKQDLIHQVVNAFRAAGRSGTKAQKSRSDLSGTTKKFKKQKGGGARHGDYRAPIFVGGGRAFAARPRSFEQKINRKMYRGAIASILSELARTGRLKVVENFDLDAPKTKQLYAKIESLGGGKTLIVTEAGSQNLFLAAQNLPYVGVVDVAGLNPVDLVYADNVVMTVDTVKKVEEWLA